MAPSNPAGYYNRACYKVRLNKIDDLVFSDLKMIELRPPLKEAAPIDKDLEGIRNLQKFKS